MIGDHINYLSEQEKIKLQDKFLADDLLVEAVRKVLLAGLYYNGTIRPKVPAEPMKNFVLTPFINALNKGENITNEKLGEDVRACGMAVYIIQDAFRNLESLKKVVKLEEKVKPTGR